MKKIIIAIFAALVAVAASAQEQQQVQNQVMEETANDYKIVSDEVVDGVRYVTATPSAKVCSKQIDIEIKDGIIQKVVYTRGCEGNAKGIGALI